MRTKRDVIGQTGTVVLSDYMLRHKQSRKRTVRYQYTQHGRGWECWVCQPIHSRMYGATGYGPKKEMAKAALERNLANSYGYLGQMILLNDGEPTK